MTTITGHFKQTKRQGFSLVEVLISTAILSIFVAIATSSIVSLSRSSTSLLNYQSMNQDSRLMLERFARDLRATIDVVQISADSLEVTTITSDGSEINVSYSYNDAAGIVYREVSGSPREIILSDVVAFDLEFFTFRGDSTTNHLETKRVQLESIMSRKALSTENTNHIISAQFVLRNHHVSS